MVSLKALAAVTLVTALAGCDSGNDSSVVGSGGSAVEGSGILVTRTEDVSDFDELAISHTFHATIAQGDSFSLSLRVDDNIVEHLRVERIGSTLLHSTCRSAVLAQPDSKISQFTMPRSFSVASATRSCACETPCP